MYRICLTVVRSFNNSKIYIRTKIMLVLLKIEMSVTYLINMDKGCSQNNKYIVYQMIS